MPTPSSSSTSAASAPGAAQFRTTHWSAVLAAQAPGPQASAALETLCRAYWRPVFAHIRRQGQDAETARDLTQEFFTRMLAGQWLQPADPQRGRFRSYLLKCLTRFLIDEWRKTTALRRGGGHEFFSIDEAREEERWGIDPVDGVLTPEQAYDRRWAEALIARANARLRADYEADGQAVRFETLKVYLQEGAEPAYADVATALGLSVPAVKSAIYKLRQRYGQAIRAEIAETVSRPEDVERELEHLLQALGG